MSDHEFAFLSSSSYLNCPVRQRENDTHPFAIAGIAFDGAVSNRPGARFAPQAIRLASMMLCDAIHPHFDVTPIGQLCDAGDLRLPNTQLDAMRASLQPQAEQLFRSHQMVWLGGDHSVTLPLLRALKQVHGGPVALLHFDAHCDTWVDHFGEPSGHGTWVYEAVQEGLIVPQATVQIGIRSSGQREAREYVNSIGGKVWTARDLRGLDNASQLAPVFADLRARLAALPNLPIYLSFDIDCLDPAFAPGTGTPEPGGLNSNQVLTILEELADLPWCGMDCVEVAPAYDHAELTTHLASSLVWTYLCGQIAKHAAAK